MPRSPLRSDHVGRSLTFLVALAVTLLGPAAVSGAQAAGISPRPGPGGDFPRVSVATPATVPLPDQVAPRPRTPKAPKPKGTTNVLVVQLAWAGRPMPDRTAELTQDVLVNPNAWYRTVSHGKYGVTGRVTPVLTTHPMKCGLSTHLLNAYERAARKAIKHAHYKLKKHRSRLVIALPCPATKYDGFGKDPGNVVWLYVDPPIPALPTPTLPAGVSVTSTETKGSSWWTWVKWNLRNTAGRTGWQANGYKFTAPYITATHEMGHNLGLNHSQLLQCNQNGVPTSTTGHCTTIEYGDPYDVMAGIYAPGSFSAMRLQQLHWLDGKVAHVKYQKTVRLAPLETAGGTKAIAVKGKGKRTYWIEYRTLNGVDAALDPAQTGVLIHYTAAKNKTKLIDAWPGSGRAWDWANGVPELTDAEQAQLRPGTSITVPGGITITTVAQDGGSATVTVVTKHHKKHHHKKKHH